MEGSTVTHDPYRLCPDAFCPQCGVKGRLVIEMESRYGDGDTEDYEVEVRTCVECGNQHDEPSPLHEAALKSMRIQFGRLIEGRPYEPPPPPKPDPNRKSPDLSFMEKMLREYYGTHRDTLGPLQFASVRKAGNEPGEYSLSCDTWAMVPESIAGIGAWIPRSAHRVGCGFPGQCDCEDE
jgi:hypothetical protein